MPGGLYEAHTHRAEILAHLHRVMESANPRAGDLPSGDGHGSRLECARAGSVQKRSAGGPVLGIARVRKEGRVPGQLLDVFAAMRKIVVALDRMSNTARPASKRTGPGRMPATPEGDTDAGGAS